MPLKIKKWSIIINIYNYDRFTPQNFNFSQMKGPKAGEQMQDAEFFTIHGEKVHLAQYIGKKIVIETGSITCPMYVKNIKKMNHLVSLFPDVVFLLIYVREAHPGERLSGHKQLNEKIECAKKLPKLENENRIILVDKIDGFFHTYAGGLPEMLYVLDESMQIITRSSWANPELVKSALTENLTLNQKKIDIREPSKPTLFTMLRVTLRGGLLGTWDLLKSIPMLLSMHAKINKKKNQR